MAGEKSSKYPEEGPRESEEDASESPSRHARYCSEELSGLQRVARRMTLSLPPKKIVSIALDEVIRATSADVSVLYLQRGEDIHLMGLRPENTETSPIGTALKRVGECLCGLAAQRGEPFYSYDIHADPQCTLQDCKEAGVRSFVSLPLVGVRRKVGVLGLASFRKRDFSEQAALLETLACQVAVALQNALLHEELQTRATELERSLTKTIQSQKALTESEERCRTVIEDLPALVCRFLPDGTLTFVNKDYCTYFNKPIQDLIGNDFFQFVPEAERQFVRNHFMSLSKEKPTVTYEHHVITPDGSTRWQQWTDRAIFDEHDHVMEYQSLGRDITNRKKEEEERKQLETHLQEAQRMEAIANLAGGIAHEFNNALAVLYGNIGLLQLNYADHERITKYCGSMQMSAQRMADLTNQLLAYARGGRYQPTDISLNEFVLGTLPLIEYSIDPEITIETDLSKEAFMVNADSTQLQMVLSAVLTNAAEAIDGEGWIWISTRNEEVTDDQAVTFPELTPGHYVCLTVRDEGKGMDETTRERLFEPFFTTKLRGRGLGMAAVYGIVKNHGGEIFIDSQIDKGTEVRIFLPAVEPERKKEKQRPAELVRGTGTILVIDDEEMIVRMTRTILEELGYRVLGARSGKEGVSVARDFDGEIDLAILDFGLPDMSGLRAYRLIKEPRPNLKVIVCSGYAMGEPIQEILDAGAEDFIQKPFSIATLSAKLKEVLQKET